MVSAQTPAIDELLERLQHYEDERPQEKVYLHLDKPAYTSGDDIWFKAYVTIGPLNFLSALSKILYVDLIDPTDKIVQSIRLPLISGVTMGDFLLTDSLPEGNYRIRAYTNWMRNFESNVFFDHTLRIGTAFLEAKRPSVPGKVGVRQQGDNSIQFFPESGQLVSGNLTKVAFKALRADGLGIAVSGRVEDGAGEQITKFESAYAGIGNFSFIPQEGQRYIARFTYADGSTAEAVLPEVVSSGYALAVNNESDKQIFVQVFASYGLVKEQEVMLLLHRNASVFYATRAKITKSESVFSIPRENIPAGVVQLTLFSPEMEPLAERALFNRADDGVLPIRVTTDKQRYGQEEPVRVQVSVGQDGDTNRVATLSATVVNVDKVPADTLQGGDIYASLLLSPDIKGYIEAPAYYVASGDPARRRALDNLMITQGWNGVDWQARIAGDIPPITYHPEQDLRVSGTVTRRSDNEPVANARVTLLSTGSVNAAIDTLTDDRGRFIFDRMLFYDDVNFVIQATDERGRRNVDIQLDESSRQRVTTNRNAREAPPPGNTPLSSYAESKQEALDDMEKYGLGERTILLEEVKVTPDTDKKRTRHSSNLNGPGNADQVIVADDLLAGCMTLDMCLQGRLLGVVFRNGIPYSTRSFNQPMQIILDGLFLEASALSMIHPFDVETIEVLRRPNTTAIYGTRGGGGVLVITTKRGDSGGYNRDLYAPGIVTHSPQGYYEIREFPAPDYGQLADSLSAGTEDLRTTIHWEPNIVTDKDGDANFTFYTAGDSGTYQIVVEGLDVNGRLARATHFITVD